MAAQPSPTPWPQWVMHLLLQIVFVEHARAAQLGTGACRLLVPGSARVNAVIKDESGVGETDLRCPRPATNEHGTAMTGTLIMLTTDDSGDDAVALLKHQVDSTDVALDVVLVTVDFKNKSSHLGAEAMRLEWAKANAARLQHLASRLLVVCGGRCAVLIEVLQHSSCMHGHILSSAFRSDMHFARDLEKSGQRVRFWKNAVAYMWGFIRLLPCVRYVVHLDVDIRLRMSTSELPKAWIRRAIHLLSQDRNAHSVSAIVDRVGPTCNVAPPGECRCTSYVFRGVPLLRAQPVSLLGAAPSCAYHFAKGRFDHAHLTGREHVSLQAGVWDVARLYKLMPLQMMHHNHHIEEMIEEAGMRHGNASTIFLSERDLGVSKCMCPSGSGTRRPHNAATILCSRSLCMPNQ
jgi:hypothetical protein